MRRKRAGLRQTSHGVMREAWGMRPGTWEHPCAVMDGPAPWGVWMLSHTSAPRCVCGGVISTHVCQVLLHKQPE